MINGRALEVLPRLTDGAYDLVFVDAAKDEYPQYLPEAIRLLREGGILALDNALWHDRVADPTQRDAETVAVRESGRMIRDDETLVPVLLPLGDGLLVAVKRGHEFTFCRGTPSDRCRAAGCALSASCSSGTGGTAVGPTEVTAFVTVLRARGILEPGADPGRRPSNRRSTETTPDRIAGADRDHHRLNGIRLSTGDARSTS